MPRRSAMHAQPQRTLKRIVKQYGRDLVYDTRRTEALLRDLSGQHPREIFVLINAQKQRVPAELLAAPSWLPYRAIHTRLSRQLQQRLAITEDAADWAVTAWASALEIAPATPDSLWRKLTNVVPKHSPIGGKKRRQDAHSGVQSSTAPKRKTAQGRTKARRSRAQRAELGWQIPAVGVTLPPLPTLRRTLTARTGWLVGGTFAAAAMLILAAVVLLTRAGDGPSQAAPGMAADPAATAAAIATPAAAGAVLSDLPEFAPSALLAQSYPTPRYAQVSEDGLLIRQGPSTEVGWIHILKLRETVRVVGYSDDGKWAEIDQPLAGWVSNDYLTYQSPDGGVSVQLRVRQVRTRNYTTLLRAAPRADAPEVAAFAPNQPVIVIALSGNGPNNWLQIAGPETGWLAVQDTMWPTMQ